jgi:hypothetical protein
LSQSSWDKTWSDMNKLIEQKLSLKQLASKGQAARINEGAPHV